MSRRLRRAAGAVSIVAVAVAVAGCSSSGGAAGPSDSTSAPAKGVGSTIANGTASAVPSVPAGASVSTTGAGPADFSSVTYATPAGFERSTAYSPAVPLEPEYTAYFLVPDSAPTGQNLIGIYVYTLPASQAVTATTNIPARITAYNSAVDATVTNPVSAFTAPGLSGYPDYKEAVMQPPNFNYLAYFAFGAHHVLEFTCQFADAASLPTLATACGQTLGTLRVQ